MNTETLGALPDITAELGRSVLASVGRRPSSLPTREVRVEGHEQDAERLARYDKLCGFVLRDRVPTTWLHVLTFPLQVHLLAGRDAPFSPAGLVHVSNEMTLHRPVQADEKLTLTSRFDGAVEHHRGVLALVGASVLVDNEVVWEGRSSYLARGVSLPEARPAAEDSPLDGADVALVQRWRLPADLGRRYAAVSGDVNPIHLHPATSRLFGFKRPIIHGMWTHARVLGALENRLPDAFIARAGFRRPILLPATVGFGAVRVDDGWRARVGSVKEEKTYLSVEVRPR